MLNGKTVYTNGHCLIATECGIGIEAPERFNESANKIISDIDFNSKNLFQVKQIEEKKNVFLTSAFKDGMFEVQDAGSQVIAPTLDVQPGMRVIDACAGAGGKTLHLAALMQNQGRLIAMDIEDWKLDELRRRARRNGVSNVETRLIEAKTIKRLRETADIVFFVEQIDACFPSNSRIGHGQQGGGD